MKRRSRIGKPIGILFLALVVCLGGMGIGYAHWTGNLFVEGTAETGTMGVGWYYYSGGDPGNDYVWDPGIGNKQPAGQDIGTANISFEDWMCYGPVETFPPGTEFNHYKTMVVTIDNAYPYYFVDWQVHAHNCGTLPVIIHDAVVNAPPELTVLCPDGVLPAKLHPCEDLIFSLIIYCNQPDDPNPGDPGVQPDTTYTFDITVMYEQAQ